VGESWRHQTSAPVWRAQASGLPSWLITSFGRAGCCEANQQGL